MPICEDFRLLQQNQQGHAADNHLQKETDYKQVQRNSKIAEAMFVVL